MQILRRNASASDPSDIKSDSLSSLFMPMAFISHEYNGADAAADRDRYLLSSTESLFSRKLIC